MTQVYGMFKDKLKVHRHIHQHLLIHPPSSTTSQTQPALITEGEVAARVRLAIALQEGMATATSILDGESPMFPVLRVQQASRDEEYYLVSQCNRNSIHGPNRFLLSEICPDQICHASPSQRLPTLVGTGLHHARALAFIAVSPRLHHVPLARNLQAHPRSLGDTPATFLESAVTSVEYWASFWHDRV